MLGCHWQQERSISVYSCWSGGISSRVALMFLSLTRALSLMAVLWQAALTVRAWRRRLFGCSGVARLRVRRSLRSPARMTTAHHLRHH
jgi:hypothetical protein